MQHLQRKHPGRAIRGILGSGPQDIEIFLGIHWIN